jgi:3-dehydroquinate synthase
MQPTILFGKTCAFSHQFYEYCIKSSNQILIITDTNVAELYGNKLAKFLSAHLLCFKPGEKSKSRATKERLENEMLKMGLTGATLLIGLGGGVVSDIAGFIAATYYRGIKLILVPTTLMGMIDASHGGKNGVNTEFGKNLIGTIYDPSLIAIDTEFLKTLPEKEKINGQAEMIKYRLIANMESDSIEEAIKLKYSIIQNNERDKLNFGHTIGHALEVASNFSISHGKAVAIGMLAEAGLSFDPKEIYPLFSAFDLSLPETVSKEAVIQALYYDKKYENGKVNATLFHRPGFSYLKKIPLEAMEREVDRIFLPGGITSGYCSAPL